MNPAKPNPVINGPVVTGSPVQQANIQTNGVNIRPATPDQIRQQAIKQAMQRTASSDSSLASGTISPADVSNLDRLFQSNFRRDVEANRLASDNQARLQQISDNNRASNDRAANRELFNLDQQARRTPDISLGQAGRTVTSSSTTVGFGPSPSQAAAQASFNSQRLPYRGPNQMASEYRAPRRRGTTGLGFGDYSIDTFVGLVSNPNGAY